MRDALRPTRLEDYVGQNHIKDVLRTSIQSAKIREDALDHVMVSGPPGLGKTTLAAIIANELGWNFHPVLSTSLKNAFSIYAVFANVIKPPVVVFIDEVHRLRKPVQETLYPVLEDGMVPNRYGTSYDQINGLVTVIGATTNSGKLERPFMDRFPLQFQLELYADEDLITILAVNAAKLKMTVTEAALEVIAERARKTPRIGNNILRRLRDYAVVDKKAIDEDFVKKILRENLGIDDNGLRDLDRQYLQILMGAPAGLGVESVAAQLNEESETVEDAIEPFLLQLGLIERRRNGRWITELGKQYLRG
jgi:Holliday junction DNA helicase RuvB